jgi:transposase
MGNDTTKQTIDVLGIDLAKNSFQLHGINKDGNIVYKRALSRNKLKEFMVNLPACLVGMEACGSSHYWARLFQSYGHNVKLMAPQFVKPYVKSNKNDAADAEAICEAVQRPNMRFVGIKDIDSQDMQSLHRMRSLAVAARTAQVNQIRGLLQEYGIDIPQGITSVRKRLPQILEDAENGISILFRELLSGLYEELTHLDGRVSSYDKKIEVLSQQNEKAKRLQTIPGIGPITATALVGSIGSIDTFKSGRELAAWLGLVPRQHSTGGKTTLLGISKRGDTYLRSLLIHGARSVLRFVKNKNDSRSQWAKRVIERRNKNIAAVALANKMTRTVFALLKYEGTYSSDVTLAI